MNTANQEKILDHYHNPRNNKKMLSSKSATARNTSCGDSVTMYTKEKKGIITDASFTGEGCAISQATASLLTEYVKKKTIEETERMDATEITKLIGISLGPVRLQCALISLEALKKTLKN
ncbi:MAG: iron-sulfur cluster assembly scaffold protein [Candidatus Moranbacteria bacterium]|nr:iron-sulfur cluster assembly scaffold protein [Candidatus Moranbacteria bacterium]